MCALADEFLICSRKRWIASDLHDTQILPQPRDPLSLRLARLDAMEGVVAFYGRDMQAAARSLSAAQDKIERLRVPDTLLAALQGMGEAGGEGGETSESLRSLPTGWLSSSSLLLGFRLPPKGKPEGSALQRKRH